MKAVNIKIDNMVNPIGIDDRSPIISWTAINGNKQSAYQVIGAVDDTIVFDTGVVKSSDMKVQYAGKTKSRMGVKLCVMLWDENNVEGEWTEAYFEFALLNSKEFKAKWINPEMGESNPGERKNAAYLKKEFHLKDWTEEKKARIYATAHGVYKFKINEVPINSTVLAPGTTEYNERLAYQTYDIGSYLRNGKNVIEVVLGDGWYRGGNGNTGTRNVFGTDIALWLQMEIDEQIVVITDESWKCCLDGYIGLNDIQLGEKVDARNNPSYGNTPIIKDFEISNLFCTNAPQLVEKERFKAKLISTPDGNKVLDFGQNMAGYICFTLEANAGDVLRLTFGEYRGEDGNFSDENFKTIGREGEELHQVVEYTCKDGLNEYKTSLSIFGFQMVKVETNIPITGEEFVAVAVYSDLEETSGFLCDNVLVNQFFKNAIWSEKSNFIDIPIDCPQRERSGWTGDAGLFVDAGIKLMDAAPIYNKWLGDCRIDQDEKGRVANIAPRRKPKDTYFDKLYNGASAWGDAIIIIPYKIYQLYGDKKILEDNYEMMSRWISYCEKKAKKTRLKNRFNGNKFHKYMIDTGIQWGEWLEAGVSVNDAMKDIILKGIPEMTTPYFIQSCRMLSKIADILGKEDDAERYEDLSEKANKAYHYIELKDGHIHSDRQCRYVRPLYMGLLTDEEAKNAAKDLNDLIISNNYFLNTGFLTTPYLCQVLADYGYVDTAYKVLLQEETPGWLFAVKNGATSVWESWEGYLGDTGFSSLNHYSKGAVTGWFITGILGIHYSFEKLYIKPQPCNLMKFASGYFDSPKGRIESAWNYLEDGSIEYVVTLPPNLEALFVHEDGRTQKITTGKNVIRNN